MGVNTTSERRKGACASSFRNGSVVIRPDGLCGEIWVMAVDVSFPLHIAAFLGFTVTGCMPKPLPRRNEVRVGVFLRAELSRMVVCHPGSVPSQGVQEDLNQKPDDDHDKTALCFP